MSNMEALRAALARLDPAQRAELLAWLADQERSTLEVREAAAAYETTPELLSVDEYLALEERSSIRHEYVAGQLFAMTGTSLRHNVIIRNLLRAVSPHLDGGPSQAFFTDIKVRLEVNRADLFYYPDLLVACGRLDLKQVYLREPKLIVEVLSPSTEAIDRREKALNYRQIASLEEYVLVAQGQPEITVHRRQESWSANPVRNAQDRVEFRSLGVSFTVAEVYEGVYGHAHC